LASYLSCLTIPPKIPNLS